MLSGRLRQRLVRHHLPVGMVVLASAAALYFTRPYADVISRLSYATAYPALVLLAFTLGIGPYTLLVGRRMPSSLDFRRDVGIWAGMTGLLHAGIGQCVHLRGRPWLYYLYDQRREPHTLPLRHDAFGFANYTGLAAAFILLALLATSNDASLRRLGTPGWKALQRWNYGCFVLTGLHTLLYQIGVEGQKGAAMIAVVLCLGLTGIIQVAGFRSRRLPA